MEVLRRTVLVSVMSALWPVMLLQMATSIDNPFSLARSRSERAGEILADALINRVQGERPVTLVGYSLGSRLIFSCLTSLAKRRAFGVVESVVFIGSPVPSDGFDWRIMRSAVSGKVVNIFSENDYILGFVYRSSSIQLGVAGLQAVKGVYGVDNLDVSSEVSGHLLYPALIGDILKKVNHTNIRVVEGVSDEQLIQLVDADIDDATEKMAKLASDSPPEPQAVKVAKQPYSLAGNESPVASFHGPIEMLDDDGSDVDDVDLQFVAPEPIKD
jgi:pimeloyl-ACP methyl ester carboxylesterase